MRLKILCGEYRNMSFLSYQQNYYNNNKDKFRNYYLKKRLDLLNEPKVEVCKADVLNKRPSKKKKCNTISVKRGEFIISWD